jgi:hypothetical protein
MYSETKLNCFQVQNNGKYNESLHKCEGLILFVNKQSNKSSTEKSRIISNIYSNMGNAYLELGKYDQALQMHNKDLDLSRNRLARDVVLCARLTSGFYNQIV